MQTVQQAYEEDSSALQTKFLILFANQKRIIIIFTRLL